MSSIDPCTTLAEIDPNTLQQPQFKLVIPRLKITTYFIQKCNIPGVIAGKANIRVPTGNQLSFPGTSIDFEPLQIQFLMDSKYRAWWQIYKWIKECQGITNDKNMVKQINMTSDMTLFIFDNNNAPLFNINFKGAFPIALGGVNLDSTVTNITGIPGTATFVYQYMVEEEAQASTTDTSTTDQAFGVSLYGPDGKLNNPDAC